MELIGQSVAVLRVDENDGHCGNDGVHGGEEVRQTILLLQLVEKDVGVGGHSCCQVSPGYGVNHLAEWALTVLKVELNSR